MPEAMPDVKPLVIPATEEQTFDLLEASHIRFERKHSNGNRVITYSVVRCRQNPDSTITDAPENAVIDGVLRPTAVGDRIILTKQEYSDAPGLADAIRVIEEYVVAHALGRGRLEPAETK